MRKSLLVGATVLVTLRLCSIFNIKKLERPHVKHLNKFIDSERDNVGR